MHILPCKNCQGVWNSITVMLSTITACIYPIHHVYAIIHRCMNHPHTLYMHMACTHSFTHLLLHTLTPSHTHTITHSLLHSPSSSSLLHSLTPSHTHSFTHPPAPLCCELGCQLSPSQWVAVWPQEHGGAPEETQLKEGGGGVRR